MRIIACFARIAPFVAAFVSPVVAGCGSAAPDDRAAEGVASTSASLTAASAFGFAAVRGNVVDATRSYNGLTDSSDPSGTRFTGTSSVSHTGNGTYAVSMPGLGVVGPVGNAQVVAEGADANRCRLVNWSVSGNDQIVRVECNRPDGSPADTDFEVMFYAGQGVWGGTSYTYSAYAWYSPSGGMPAGSYNYNSTTAGGTPNAVGGTGGVHQVTFPGVSYQNASVLVSAYGGSGAPFCNVRGWAPSGSGTVVTVGCYDTNGNPADVGFSISYALTGPTLEQQGGHAWVNGSMPLSYAMAVGPSLGCSGSISLRGSTVHIDGLAAWGAPWPAQMVQTAFTTGYGGAATYCKLASFVPTSTTADVNVSCFTANGSPASSAYTVTVTSNQPAGPC